MKNIKHFAGILFAATLILIIGNAEAGMPMTNLEGVGGVGFNPLAYPANPGSSLGDPNSKLGRFVGKPQIGAWYVNLGEVKANWTSFGVAETFAKRLELSFAHETISIAGSKDITKDNFGMKLLMIEENAGGNKWMPAVSAGFIGKHTDNGPLANTDSSGYDLYLVATKFITALPLPVLISGGILSTDGQTTGVFGYNDDRDITWFGNFDVLPLKDVAVGIEYKQGAKFNDGFKNANYWNAHVAWSVNKNLTVIGAYINAGNEHSDKTVGLGEGVVLSLQYAF